MTERAFHVGQAVRIVRGGGHGERCSDVHRTGCVTRVASGLFPFPSRHQAVPLGTLVHLLEGEDSKGDPCAAPPSWLEPYDEGREPAEWTEELRELCGRPVSA